MKNTKSNLVSVLYKNRGVWTPYRNVVLPRNQVTQEVLDDVRAATKRPVRLGRVSYQLV